MILLITITFYLGRGLILKKAVRYLNENQPGEVHLGKMNLIPLVGFPNAVVQFKDVIWYENPVNLDSLHQEPLVYLHDLFVSIDVPELIRKGVIKVEKFRLKDGFVRIEVYADSAISLSSVAIIDVAHKRKRIREILWKVALYTLVSIPLIAVSILVVIAMDPGIFWNMVESLKYNANYLLFGSLVFATIQILDMLLIKKKIPDAGT